MVTEHEPRLGNVVSKNCPLTVPMRSQSKSITGVHVIPDNMAKGAV